MNIDKTEGITLQSIPYKERQKIITVFTKEKGIITLIAKGISKKNTSLISISDPFCLCNFIYKKGKSDIFFLKDLEILDNFLFLRNDLEDINIACKMAKSILKSQMPHKTTPFLYILFKKYLKKITFTNKKNALFSSFLLKVLIHDGLFHLKKRCNICNKKSTNIQRGESLCENHSTTNSFFFSEEELQKIEILTYKKTFKEIEIEINNKLKDKIYHLFYDLI